MRLKIYLSINLKRIHSFVHMEEPYLLLFIHSTLEIEKSNYGNFMVVFSDYIFKISGFFMILFLNCFGGEIPRMRKSVVFFPLKKKMSYWQNRERFATAP